MNLDPDGLYYWLQCSFIDPIKIGKLTQQFEPDYEPLIVEFEIYQKYKLPCGFPKCQGEMTQEEFAINGRCGLQEFLNTPIKINRDGVSPEEYQKYKSAIQEIDNKLLTWKDSLNKQMAQLRDYGATIATNVFNKHVTMQNFMNIAQQTLPALNFIPKDCLTTVCDAVREASGENSIKGISSNFQNAKESAKLLIKDTLKSYRESGLALWQSAGDLWKTTIDGVGGLLSTFNVYQLCPRRYNDWLTDAADKLRSSSWYQRIYTITKYFCKWYFTEILKICYLLVLQKI